MRFTDQQIDSFHLTARENLRVALGDGIAMRITKAAHATEVL
jgi:hypothetical protein